jgi:hypothetical protein
MSDELKILFTVERFARHQNSKFYDALINIPENVIKKENLVFVDTDEAINTTVNVEELEDRIQSGTKITSKKENWIYIPYNLNDDKYATQLKQELSNQNITQDNLLDKLKENKAQIIGIYKSVLNGVKNFNANSLVVYSGPSMTTNKVSLVMQSSDISVCDKIGVLYLGDFDAKNQSNMDFIKDKYKSYWNHIGIVQIPHHGSIHNFHDDLIWKDSYALISIGFKYNHPNQKVLDAIDDTNSNLLLVTSVAKSKVVHKIIEKTRMKEETILQLSMTNKVTREILVDIYPEYFFI